MVALTGAGALAGALLVAAVPSGPRRGRLMLAMMGGFGLMLTCFARSGWAPLSFALLLGVGGASTSYTAINNTLRQTYSSDEMRGRVMSVFFLNRGLVPLGTLLAGIGARLVGASLTLALMGLGVISLALVIASRVRTLRDIA